MDKSSKVVEEALQRLHEAKAACVAAKPRSNEQIMLIFAIGGAEAAYRAALRVEKTPRVDCTQCQRRFKPGEPMVWQWLGRNLKRQGQHAHLCLRCDRREHGSDRLADLDQQPCETCERPMYFDMLSWSRVHRPLTCSYQCGYRRKIKGQLARKKVEPATVACAVCGEMFTQARRDARTCSGRCRAKLFRQRKKVAA